MNKYINYIIITVLLISVVLLFIYFTNKINQIQKYNKFAQQQLLYKMKIQKDSINILIGKNNISIKQLLQRTKNLKYLLDSYKPQFDTNIDSTFIDNYMKTYIIKHQYNLDTK